MTEKWLTVDGRSDITFKAVACSDAILTVAPSVGITYAHQVTLGKDGTSNTLNDPSGKTVDTKAGNPLHCTIGKKHLCKMTKDPIEMINYGFFSVGVLPYYEHYHNEYILNYFFIYSSANWFWLSWKQGVISVGSGTEVGYNNLLSYDTTKAGTTLDVGAIGFRTEGQNGMWEFSQLEGICRHIGLL